MALFLNDHGGFRVEMTPQEHFNTLNRKPTATATRVLPPTSEYTKLLIDQWNEAFRPNGELFEENWDFIEKIFAPISTNPTALYNSMFHTYYITRVGR